MYFVCSFLSFAANNQNSCGKLGNIFVMWAGGYERMLKYE